MKRAGILFRFIDLGLVLLMAFLATADLRAERQLALRAARAQVEASADEGAVYRLRFDGLLGGF